MNRILRINLSSRKIYNEEIEQEVLKSFLGGTGLGGKLLYDRLREHIDPLSPENLLILTIGPLTGSGVPGSGTYAVISKSTLTSLAVASHSNGFFGARLKWAGYGAVIIEGSSEKFVTVFIGSDKVTIEDAEDLRGKDTWETEQYLLGKYGKKNVSVACIGPAGENLVRYAGIFNDIGHVAASGGVGAVMGSKRLKAIIVSSTKQGMLQEDRKKKLLGLIKTWNGESQKTGVGKVVSTTGSIGLFEPYYNRGWIPIKNLTTNIFDEYERFGGGHLRAEEWETVKRRPCFGCTFNHCQDIRVKSGPYKGVVVEEPEYEDMAGWGANVGVKDPGATAMITNLNDRLGMDLKEACFTISMAMECFEKGIITKNDTDGIELNWGNVDSIIHLLRKVASKDGFGNILAEGVMRAADKIGKGAPNLAVYVKKGNAPHVHDLRTRWGTLFTQAISDMGSQQGIDLTLNISPDVGINEPIGFPDEKVAMGQVKTGAKRQLLDSAIFCYFCDSTLKTTLEAINLLTGFDLDINDGLKIGERIINLFRVFNIKNGLTPEHDTVSPRLLEPPVDGPQKGLSFAPTFENVKKTYYSGMGWDITTGKPLPETLNRLGLGYTINKIW
jgi:aldehyde:ferredoxin oxidoreductase